MMRIRTTLLTTLLLLIGVVHADEKNPQGLPIGSEPLPFLVKDYTGPASGKTLCYYCRYGGRPVVAIFTRSVNKEIGRLVAEIEGKLKVHRAERLSAFVVYVAPDTPESVQELKSLAEQHQLVRTPLTILSEPEEQLRAKYGFEPELQVLVIGWRGGRVRANQAILDAQPNEEEIKRISDRVEQMMVIKQVD